MNKTAIEWCDYTVNPVKGLCPIGCPYCYARRMYKRFKWNPRQHYDAASWLGLGSLRNPSRIFVGSTYELFGEWVNPRYLELCIETAREFPIHTFIFLTKKPENLIKWSPFPDNCWVGVSVTANGDMTNAYYGLSRVETPVRFISFEPLLGQIGMDDHVNIKSWVDWVIIGAQTPYSKKTAPRIEWVKEIVEAADKAGIPVFLKDNLAKLFSDSLNPFPVWAFKDGCYTDETHPYVDLNMRQEFPNKHPAKSGVVIEAEHE